MGQHSLAQHSIVQEECQPQAQLCIQKFSQCLEHLVYYKHAYVHAMLHFAADGCVSHRGTLT